MTDGSSNSILKRKKDNFLEIIQDDTRETNSETKNKVRRKLTVKKTLLIECKETIKYHRRKREKYSNLYLKTLLASNGYTDKYKDEDKYKKEPKYYTQREREIDAIYLKKEILLQEKKRRKKLKKTNRLEDSIRRDEEFLRKKDHPTTAKEDPYRMEEFSEEDTLAFDSCSESQDYETI